MVVRMVILCCDLCFVVFFFKQKTAYEMRISDWSSDVCSSDLQHPCDLGRGDSDHKDADGMSMRTESDSIGDIEVAAEAYWGAQTERSRHNLDRKSVV